MSSTSPRSCSVSMLKLLVLGLVEDIGQSALSAVLAVKMCSHKHTSSTLLGRALPPQTVDLAVVVDLVVLEDGQLHLTVLVLDLLGSCVILLLTLLGSSPQSEDQVQG